MPEVADHYIGAEILLEETRWQDATKWHKVMMPIELLWVEPIKSFYGYYIV